MNTSKLLNAVNGAFIENGKSTVLHSLYDMNFKGCYSCFGCKKVNSPSYGKCVIKDDLFGVLEEIRDCSILIMATPIYFRDVAGELRSFIERLLFQSLVYSTPPRSAVKRRIKVGMIYTMNITKEQYENYPLKSQLEALENSINMFLGETKSFFAFGTNQLESYEGIEYTYINSEERLKNHNERFPKEMKRAEEFTRSLI